MKIIKLSGGLGNQMFQYSYGRSMELDGKKVTFDVSFFNGNKSKIDTAREYKLDYYNIYNKSRSTEKGSSLSEFKNKIFRRLGKNIDEFYQSEKYFKNIQDVIRKEFTLKEPLGNEAQKISDEISKSQNPVSIHIRRGDYVSDKKTNEYHGTCGLDYYEKAVEYIKEKIQSPTFFVFSDDINWVKENLKLENSVYVSRPEIKDYEELVLMSKCKHHIIANSSFSWWGAWLNPDRNRIVISPKQWTAKKTSDELDILPKDWIQF